MVKKNSKKQSFMAGVFTIMFAQVLIKLLGFAYRHVLILVPEFGDEGSGLYGIGFNIYMLLLSITTVGVPGAISKMVSDRVARGKVKEAKHIFKVAMLLFIAIGLAGSIIMVLLASSMAKMAGNEAATGVLLALAPSVVFVAIAAVIRGYFNGLYNMKPASINQTVEQIFKAGLTILFVYGIHYIYTNRVDLALSLGITENTVTMIMAVWANVASTLSTAIGLVYLFIYFKIHKKDIDEIKENIEEKEEQLKSVKDTIKSILALSIPMSLASIVSAVNRNIDSFTVNNILQEVLPTIKPTLAGNARAIVDEATRLYGILSGKVDMLIGLPLAINVAFATAIVPAVSECLAKKDVESAANRISYSIRMSLLIALPCSLGLCVLAEPILELLFHGQVLTSPESVLLLQISAFTVLFTVTNQTINASLQGIGKIFMPALALLVGVVFKLILNLILIRIPQINVYGAAIGSVCCHLTATIIVANILRKSIKIKFNIKSSIIKPILATTIMCLISLLTLFGLEKVFGNGSRIATIAALAMAVISYGIAVVKLKILSEEDYKILPAGEKIYGILKKIRLV
jgi:stage V sporulation protein B